MTGSLVAQSQAKVNLVLEVLGRRDTYHDILSVAQTISLHDMLTFEEDDNLVLTCNQPSLVEGNLVLKAASLLKERAQVNKGARIHLDKRIPWGAGLGGGSSNAAATLSALNSLWGCGLATEALAQLGAELGSDVPLFLLGGTVLLEGRGDRATALPQLQETHLVLLVPGSIGMPDKTASLYERLEQTDFTRGQFVRAAAFALERNGFVPDDLMFNAFENAAFEFFPGLRDDYATFADMAHGNVHLAGSGPCLYAVCRNAEEAIDMAGRLSNARCDARVVHTTGQSGDT
ncbi:4-(cytidine 5'-diphospho)-2-C-methyl-D-erythritol kinase [Chloroflexota bacterium]